MEVTFVLPNWGGNFFVALQLIETINLGQMTQGVEKISQNSLTNNDKIILETQSQFSRSGWVYQQIIENGKTISYNWRKQYHGIMYFPTIDLSPNFRLGFLLRYPTNWIRVYRLT